MRILVVSDEECPALWDYYVPGRLKEYDLIISCGDLKASYLSFLVTMGRAPVLYVPGNHDHDYLKRPPEGCDCIDDQFVVYNGVRILGLGDADDPAHWGFESLIELLDQYHPKYLLHGHVHLRYGFNQSRERQYHDTTIINVTERYSFDIPDRPVSPKQIGQVIYKNRRKYRENSANAEEIYSPF